MYEARECFLHSWHLRVPSLKRHQEEEDGSLHSLVFVLVVYFDRRQQWQRERERDWERDTPGEKVYYRPGEVACFSSSSSSLSLCLSFFLRARLWKVGSRRCHESAAWSRWKCTGGTRESSRIRRGYLACLTRRSTYISKRGNCVVRKVRGFEVGKISDDESEFNS